MLSMKDDADIDTDIDIDIDIDTDTDSLRRSFIFIDVMCRVSTYCLIDSLTC